jgi:DNA-binding transcriptional ArsR family regulator
MYDVQLENQLEIQSIELKKAALHFRAVNHQLRQQIMQLIHKNQKITVTELYRALHLEQSVASQHLAILRHANVVCTKRDGKRVFYSINYRQLEFLHQKAAEIISR